MKLSIKELGPFRNDVPGLFRHAAQLGCTAIHIHLPDRERVAQIRKAMQETGVRVASVGAMSTKMLGPDAEAMAHEHRQVERALAVAHELEATTVSQFMGHDTTRSLDENIETFAKVYEPHAMIAERLGIRLAFENCPMIGNGAVAQNLFYAPAIWDRCFEAIDSSAIAIEFDVSHFCYVGVDPVPLVSRYRDRIAHVHIKDCRLFSDRQQEVGVLRGIPHGLCPAGEGGVPIGKILTELQKVDYTGYITGDIEGNDLEAAQRNITNTLRIAADVGCKITTLGDR